MDANYQKDKHSIDGFYLQSRNAWFAGGKYYESGNLAGLIDTYIFKMDEPKPTPPKPTPPKPTPTSNYPGSAARDYYSGVVLGWVGVDIKAEMDTCFPDDKYLAELIEDSYNAWDTGDWVRIMVAN